MSKRKKKIKIEQAMSLPNVFQPDTGTPDVWEKFFGMKKTYTLELGCGAGAYTLGLAQLYPERCIIGVDIKGARIWNGATTALQHSQENVAFLRSPIECIGKNFTPGTVEEIWITFPDPFPRKKHAKNRLTSPRFLDIYKTLLVKNGTVNLKTDDETLFDYSVETAEANGWTVEKLIKNLYTEDVKDPELLIQTVYEKRHRAAGKKVYYVRLSLPLSRE